jgi:hypothetical protein
MSWILSLPSPLPVCKRPAAKFCFFLCLDEIPDHRVLEDNLVSVPKNLPVASHCVVLLGLGGRNWNGSLFSLFKERDWPMEVCYTVFSFGGICGIDFEMKCAAFAEGLNKEAECRCLVSNLRKSISHSPWMIVWSLYQNLQSKFVGRIFRADALPSILRCHWWLLIRIYGHGFEGQPVC